jgi:serine/threonine protein kinase
MDEKQIFLQALEIPDPREQAEFLARKCGEDGPGRRRIEELLRSHAEGEDRLKNRHVPEGLAEAEPSVGEIDLDFLAPSDDPESLGRLEGYEVRDVLGQGGMGTVLKALDTNLNRPVAVKVLAPALAANAVARKRFLREARAAAAVKHPDVVTIYAVERGTGVPYLVMEYVDGVTLQQKIEQEGAIPVVETLRIGTQLAEGLEAAHAQGLVHRDMKPSNVLLENCVERVKITDFGLARAVDDVSITKTGEVAGTPEYMSPEQALGELVDHRSDLFSLGSILYAMCAGRPPFRGTSSLAIMKRVCEDTPRPLRELNPDVPEWLVRIIDRLLAKNPDERFQSAGKVAELLGRHLAMEQDPVAASSQRPSNQPSEAPATVRPRRGRGWLVLPSLLIGLSVLLVLEGSGTINLRSLLGITEEPVPEIVEGDPDLESVTPEPDRPGTQPPALNEPEKFAPGAADRPVKVFIMAGGSNMSGRAANNLLKYQAQQPATKKLFEHLIQGEDWVVRKDVWVKDLDKKGALTVGFGQVPHRFGPELEFGHLVGNYYEEQVLIIKTCWGGFSLYRDFRPPSAGYPPEEQLQQLLEDLQKQNPRATLDDVKRSCGVCYRRVLETVRETLANLDTDFPAYEGQGYEIAGFVWFQAWNDKINPVYCAAYKDNMIHFIRDVRKDLKKPNLPFVIGQFGNDGVASDGGGLKQAQAEAAQLDEFRGNVKLVQTDVFWDTEADAVFRKGWQNHSKEWEKVGSDFPYHYLGSARTFVQIGRAFGEAIIDLCAENKKASAIKQPAP